MRKSSKRREKERKQKKNRPSMKITNQRIPNN